MFDPEIFTIRDALKHYIFLEHVLERILGISCMQYVFFNDIVSTLKWR